MNDKPQIRVLLVEDNPADARLIREMLMETGAGRVSIVHVETLSQALVLLGTEALDAVLLDMTLPDSQWPHTLVKVLDCSPDTPVVVLSGLDDEERALNSVQKGAQDYLVKGGLDGELIERALRYAIERQRMKVLLKETADAVRDSELRLKTIVDKNADGMVVVSKDGHIRFVNPSAEKIFRRSKKDLRDIFSELTLSQAGVVEIEEDCSSGGKFFFEIHSVETEWEEEDVFIVTVRDTTERRAAETKVRLSARVMESVLEGIFVTDRDFLISTVNQAFSDITEWEQDRILGKRPVVMSAGDYDASIYMAMEKRLLESGLWEGEVWNRRHKSGEVYPAWLRVSSIKDDLGVITHYVGIMTDITQRKLFEEHLHKMAHYDVLTGLPNRALLMDRLNHAIAEERRRPGKLAVLFIDLDNFKPVNDTMGHDVGDLLLREVADRLKLSLRESDTVARLGGDEFMVILSALHENRNAEEIACAILVALGKPFSIKGHECRIGASIGISLYPDDGSDTETLIKNADSAMYLAKERGKNNYHMYKGGAHGPAI